MAKRTVTFSNYQEPTWEEYTGEDPPANKWYTGTVKSAKYLSEDDQVMFVIEISDPDSPFKGWGRGWYGPLDSSSDTYWKTQEMVKAIQGGKTTDVTVDFENQKALDTWIAKAKQIKFQTQDYNDKITIRKVRPLLEVAGAPVAKKAAATVVSKAAPEPEPDEDDNVEDYTEEELTALSDDELIEILKEEFDVPDDDEDWPKKGRRDRTGAVYHKALVDFVLDVQDEGEEEGGDEPEGDDGEPEFDDGFVEDAAEEPEPDPEPEPPARTRRTRAAKAAPAAAPAKATAAPAARRRRG